MKMVVREGIGRLFSTVRARFVPPALNGDSDAVRRAGIVIALSAIVIPLGLTRVAALVASGLAGQAVFALSAVLVAAIAPLLMRKTGSVRLAGELLTATVFVVGVRLIYVRGGVGTPPATALGALPLVATFVAGRRSGILWTILVLVALTAFGVLRVAGVVSPVGPTDGLPLEMTGALLFPVLMLGLALAYEWTKTAALEAKSAADRERARAEQESSILRADRMASVGQLAAGVAHEANNPLGYVTANLAFIEERLSSLDDENVHTVRPELQEALAEARQGAERIARVVRDLKAYARPTTEDALDVIHVEVALEAALKMALPELRHRAQLIRAYSQTPPVVADETRLTQVFLNLLLNAAHALPEGRVNENRVEIKLGPAGDDGVLVEISDTGSGITPEHLPRVTDPFFTTKPPGIGTGLGLAVCKQIVDAMRGELVIESTLGLGTTVRMRFVAAPGESTKAVRAAPRPRPVDGRHRILLVDDDPLVLRGLVRMLRDHDVTAVGSGLEALELVASGAVFDAILCDVMMPDLTGTDVHERLLEISPRMAEKLVFLTGGVSTGPTAERLERLDNPRLDKPVDADVLAAMVSAVARRESSTDAA